MMKKFTLIGLGLLCATGMLKSQQPANAGFEDWQFQELYDEPDEYTTSNAQLYMATGSGNVSQSIDAYEGSYAAELETVVIDQDTVGGMMFIGIPGDSGVDGGYPYTESPDSISFYAQYDIMPDDTAGVLIGFKNNGTMFGYGAASITGTSSDWTRISFPLTYFLPMQPDTMFAIIYSSNLNGGAKEGSVLLLDSITMIGATQEFPNPSFEQWTNLTQELPDDWTTVNPFIMPGAPLSATKSTDSYEGTYAMQITNSVTIWGDTLGFITNGFIGDGVQGGMPVNANPKKLTGYYKYAPNGVDSALAGLWAYYDGEVIDSSLITLPATDTYTYFEVLMDQNDSLVIDTLNIAFASGDVDGDIVTYGSTLLVDALQLEYYPNGLEENESAILHQLYPNPAVDFATLYVDLSNGKTYQLEVYNSIGQKIVSETNISQSNYKLNVGNLTSGIYTYRLIVGKNHQIINGGHFMVK